MKFEPAVDIREYIEKIVEKLQLGHIDPSRIVCMRSKDSKSRAIARIWSLPRMWQHALNVEAHYIIEVLSEKYDILEEEEKIKTLIHEIMHIPKTFSGGLVPHNCFGKKINSKSVEKLYRMYMNSE